MGGMEADVADYTMETMNAAALRQRRIEHHKLGLCRDCSNLSVPGQLHCEPCRKRHLKRAHETANKIREQTFALLGSKCMCCGEVEPTILTVDHKFGGGNKHRKSLGLESGGTHFYKWLLKQPPEYMSTYYQVLCFNCNISKHRSGGTCHHSKNANY